METHLATLLKSASKVLEQKILALNFSELSISDYSKKYWADNIRKLNYIMQCNSFILQNAIEKLECKLEEVVLLESGGGTGTLSLLALQLGIKNVFYNDIYDVSCNDAKTVATQLNLVAHDYICADSGALANYFQQTKNVKVNVVASRNVIEHIYDLENYYKNISKVSDENLVLCFATTANISNPLVNLYTRNIQRKAENIGVKGKWEKNRDSVKSFFQIRKEIIRDNFPEIEQSKIDFYAKCTRGLMFDDVIDKVNKYQVGEVNPQLPKDSTNTCDPFTGNRTENLLTVKEYRNLVSPLGYKFFCYSGFYNTNYKLRILNILTPVLNVIISSFPFVARFFAPFICLVAVRKKGA